MDIFDRIKTQAYADLTEAERFELHEVCANQEEYEELQRVLIHTERIKGSGEQPGPETKERLDRLFAETYLSKRPLWYNSVLAMIAPKDKPMYRQPLIQLAALVLMVLLVVPLFDRDPVIAVRQIAEYSGESKQQELNREIEPELSEVQVTETEEVAPIRENNVSRQVEQFQGASAMVLSERMEASVAEAEMTSTHPDGVFMGVEAENIFSQSGADTDDLLHLLTAAY